MNFCELGKAAGVQDNVSVQRLYKAIAAAETGGEKDPWIRTRVAPKKGSSAYGPLQLTKTLADDYLERKPIFSPQGTNYLQRFSTQGKKFLDYGREPNKPGYDPRYDYGGQGDLRTTADKADYGRVVKAILGSMLKEYGSPEKVLTRWRGKSEKQDPRYYKRFRAAYGS